MQTNDNDSPPGMKPF